MVVSVHRIMDALRFVRSLPSLGHTGLAITERSLYCKGGNSTWSVWSGSSLRHTRLVVLERCPYCGGRDCTKSTFIGTHRTVSNREVYTTEVSLRRCSNCILTVEYIRQNAVRTSVRTKCTLPTIWSLEQIFWLFDRVLLNPWPLESMVSCLNILSWKWKEDKHCIL